MEWSSVIENPLLRDLPFKIELNRAGQILMSPASNRHGWIQSKLTVFLARKLEGGEIITECSIRTSDGVKVADVAWASADFLERFGFETPYPEAPEICIEILSPSSSGSEIESKVDLYLARGAEEVWVVDEELKVRFYGHRGRLDGSLRLPGVTSLND